MSSPGRFALSRFSAAWLPWILGAIMLIAALIFPMVVDRPKFWLPNIGVRSFWLAIIAMSLVFLNRYVGLLSLAQIAIAGVSAYGVGFMMVTKQQPFLLAVVVALAVGTLAAFLTALITARTKAIYFLMITLAISQVFYSWASQAIEITNARRGLAPVRRPELGPLDLSDLTTFYYFALAVAILCYVLCRYVAGTNFGLTLQGVRDSPERMKALGYNIANYRVAAITFAGFIASIGGVILVLDRAQVDPDVVSLTATLDVLVVAVIGGVGSLGGTFVGALVVTLLTNFGQDFTDRYMTLTGIIFIFILLFAPAGIAGIGKQISRLIDKVRHAPVDDADETQGPPTTRSAELEVTKGSKQ